MHVLRYLDEIRPTDDIPEITEAAKQRAKLESEEIPFFSSHKSKDL
jgi:hypothetical protein